MGEKDYIKGLFTGVGLTACICAGILLGVKFGKAPSVLNDRETTKKLRVLEMMIDEYCLWDKDEEQLKEGLYTGLIYGLGDPYSRYYTAQEYEEENTATQGEYVGIGVVITQNQENQIEVVECYEGGPGELAGLEPGDVITAVDGKETAELSTREVVDLIKGGGAGSVNLTIYREGTEAFQEISVAVTDVELPSVYHEMLENDIGYIRITEFKGVTGQQYKDAFKDLETLGMKKLVVDLRDNPGGLMSSVCDVLREILPEGLIVYTEDKYGNREEEMCEGSHPLEMPLAVLVNGNSASASEIFAGAVKDYGIGTIVGTTTFGKGIVQSIRKLSDGSAVKLTVSDYYTPKGNSIHKVGIKPDVEVKPNDAVLYKREVSHEEDNQLQAALEILSPKGKSAP